MNGFLLAVVATAAVLGFMILIHEFGHYITAKMFGVRVEVFSIGFGTRLLGWKKGDTDYRISAIPLGGYVRMSGENPMEARTGDPGEFLSHPRWQRFIIAIAGPFMNIFLALALLTGVYMVSFSRPIWANKPALIGYVIKDSAAAKTGIQPGDRILRVANGELNPTWQQVIPEMVLSPNQPVQVELQRGDQTFTKTVVPEPTGPDQYGSAGWVPDQPNVVTSLEEGLPADKAGMKLGDKIVAVNGKAVRSVPAIIDTLQDAQGKPASFTVERDGKQLNLTITPELVLAPGEEEKRWRIGISCDPDEVTQLSFVAAMRQSWQDNKKSSYLILELVEKMVRRQVSMRQMEGPIGIARASGEAAKQGLSPLLELTAAISLNLGIFNLFPIPILDGGVILMLFIESLMGHDISLQVKERVYQMAFLFLVLFFVVVIYNDLVKTLPGLAQRLP
ncbi:MAG TPA: RIP metalloprotease RseP [Terriglobales bacterium]|nr:RIP metalloprotease RseP [Terriglobales bacterium]